MRTEDIFSTRIKYDPKGDLVKSFSISDKFEDKIEAIKWVRRNSNYGLRESKEIVDNAINLSVDKTIEFTYSKIPFNDLVLDKIAEEKSDLKTNILLFAFQVFIFYFFIADISIVSLVVGFSIVVYVVWMKFSKTPIEHIAIKRSTGESYLEFTEKDIATWQYVKKRKFIINLMFTVLLILGYLYTGFELFVLS